MASDYDPKTLIPAVVGVLILLGIVAIGSKPFQPLRPEPAKTLDYSTSTPFKIQARLWQDPFAAILDYDKENISTSQNSALLEVVRTVLLNKLNTMSKRHDTDYRNHFVECWRNDINLKDVDDQHKCRNLIETLVEFGKDIEHKQTDQFGNDVLGILSGMGREYAEINRLEESPLSKNCRPGQNTTRTVLHSDCNFRSLVIETFSIGTEWREKTKLQEQIIEDILGLRSGFAGTNLFEPIYKLIKSGKPLPKTIDFIGVSLPSGPYSDLAERRMRSRYAVISALSDRGYHPVDAEHINVWRSMSRRCLFPSECVVSAAAYEWFKNPDENSAAVIMWFKDEEIGDYPLSKFHRISVLVNRAYDFLKADVDSGSDSKMEYSLLGPYSSTHFDNIYLERHCFDRKYREESFSCVETFGDDYNKEILKNLRIYNWSATKLFPAESKSNSAPKESHRAWEDLERPPVRVVVQDQNVAYAIVNELQRRGLSPRNHAENEKLQQGIKCRQVHEDNSERIQSRHVPFLNLIGMGGWYVLLVGESDTEYSRELLQSFCNTLSGYNATVDQVTYLRGIDGQLPGDAGGRGSAKRSSINGYEDLINEIAADTGQDGAAGRNQFDYLRRLVDQVSIHGRAYDAIGVLGSDVYDKILVMQALRAKYPNALYFTTDLDALYLHSSLYPAVKNALVGSSYGLTTDSSGISEKNGKRQIPFRDSYQTSLYQAVTEVVAAQQNSPQRPTPAVYEIGRNQLFRLGTNDIQKIQATGVATPSLLNAIFTPLLSAAAPTPFHVLLFLFAGIAGFFLIIRDLAFGSSWSSHRNRFALASVSIVIFVYLFSLVLFAEEVRNVFAGVSVAPGFVLIWIALGLTVLIYLQLNQSLNNFADHFAEKYFTSGDTTLAVENIKANPLWQQFLGKMGFKPCAEAYAASLTNQAGEVTSDEPHISPHRNVESQVERYLDKITFSGFFIFYLLLLVILMPPVTVYLSYQGEWWLPRPIVIALAYFLVLAPITRLTLRLRKLMVSLQVLMTGMDKHFDWDAEIINRYAIEHGLTATHAKHGMDLLFIAELTSAVYKFFYGPLAVILLLFSSRLPFFDQWPVADGISYGLVSLFLVSIYQSYRVHKTALNVRDGVLRKLQVMRIGIMADRKIENRDSKDDRLKSHDYLVTELSELHKGAYLPLSQQPFVRLLLFLVGASGIVFLQFMPGLFF